MAQTLDPPKAPEVPVEHNPPRLNLRQVATEMMNLTPSELNQITTRHPQRDIPQIILVIGIHLSDLPIVEWVCDNHNEVIAKVISTDTWSVVSTFGINPPQSS